MHPRISVVIPLYNKAPHILKTLDSVFAQSVQPCEIIVVDDGSTDGGGEKVAGIRHHPELHLISQDNQGVSVARNSGIEHAKGDFVAFLDADDSWKRDHIDELVKLIRNYPEVNLYTTMHQIRMDGDDYTPPLAFPLGYLGLVKDFCGAYARGLSLVTSSTACARRAPLMAIGGFPVNVRQGEDVITWIKLALGNGAAHSSRVTAIYNRDAVNRAANSSGKQTPESLLFLAGLLSKGEVDKDHRKGVKRLFSNIAFYTSARNREVGAWAGLFSILAFVGRHGYWPLAMKIALLVLAPPKLLAYAKNRRRQKNEGEKG